MQTQPDKQNETGEIDSDLSNVQLPLKSLTSQPRQSQTRKQVLLTDDGELAEPLPVEPSSEIDDQPSLERFVKPTIQTVVITICIAIGVLLSHLFPGTPVISLITVYAVLAAVSVMVGYGLAFLYDALLNPYSYNYDQTAQALYWDAVWSLCKLAASIVWTTVTLILVLIGLVLFSWMSSYSDHREEHDWDYRR